MVIVETSFPRGGTVKAQPKSSDVDFGARQEKRKKDKKKKKSSQGSAAESEISKEIKAVSAELLSHKTIQEEMIIMGMVKSVDPTYMKISLPGRIVGRVLASSISESYSKLMQKYVESGSGGADEFKPLPELFQIGQIVYAKVMGITNTNHGRLNINLSLKPGDVHSAFTHQQMRKGQLFCGAIEEVQDHGYIIESGVKNLRCFVPYDSSEKGLNVGQLVCLRVEKITHTAAASTAVCKSVEGGNRKVKDMADTNLDYILPSSTINFTITKILKDGLQGTVMNGTFTAYVNEHQLEDAFQVPSDYEVNSSVNARVLYVMPLTKLVYLSLRTRKDDELFTSAELKRGTIVENATVHHIGTGGIIFDLEGHGKGLVSFKSIRTNLTGNYDQDEVLAKYKKGSTIKVRVLEYDPVDHLYTCSDNPVVVNQKFYALEDLKPGDFVTGIIGEKDAHGGYFVRVGNVRGLIEKIFLCSTTSSASLQENAKIRCRVTWVNADRNIAYLTNRSEYMSKTAKILTSSSAAKLNRSYVGTIVKCHEKCFIVRFFGNVKGILYKNRISELMSDALVSFCEGTTMNFRILFMDDEKITLGLAEQMHKMGECCEATVTNVIQHGLEIVVGAEGEEQMKGLVPVRLLSDFQELVAGHLKTYAVDDSVKVVCILKNLYSARDVEALQAHRVKLWKDLQSGDILKGWIKNVTDDIIEILLPIQKYETLVKVHINMFLERAIVDPNVMLVPDQPIYVKVLSKENSTKTIAVSAKLSDVWDRDLKSTGQLFARYLGEVEQLRKHFKDQDNPIGTYSIGESVKGKLLTFNKMDDYWIVQLPNNVRGIIKAAICANDKSLKEDKEVTCTVLWVDYSLEVVYLTHKTKDAEHISAGNHLEEKFKNQVGINAKILLKTNDFTLCSIRKGKHPLIFIPAQLHFNDFENSTTANIKEGEFYRVAFIHDKYSVAVLESSWKFWKKMAEKRKADAKIADSKVPSKKAKILKDGDDKETDQPAANRKRNYVSLLQDVTSDDVDEDEDHSNLYFKDTGEKKSKKQSTPKQKEKPAPSSKDETTDSEPPAKRKTPTAKDCKSKHMEVSPLLPGANDFWSIDLSSLNNATKAEQSESSDEDAETNATTKKKKKQTSAEKFKASREEEARLRQIEENYANPHKQPETADEFDRLVLANPNSSMTWISYMVFHLQAAEIDKARSIARKALKSISFREEQEIINIWVALLNLELRYGTKETFTEILKESTLCNDSFKIYTRCLQILSDANKIQELNDMVPTVTKKFKDKPDIWKCAASAYFQVGLGDKAKQLLNKALVALPERDHINTIVAFANLHHRNDDKEMAHTLLDQVVTSYPKRVDVWSQYVDILIKDSDIESARRTLERAVAQKIPIKKMRTLFKKYLEFEEKYGDEESVFKVKQLAANYVKNEVSS